MPAAQEETVEPSAAEPELQTIEAILPEQELLPELPAQEMPEPEPFEAPPVAEVEPLPEPAARAAANAARHSSGEKAAPEQDAQASGRENRAREAGGFAVRIRHAWPL